MMSTQIKLHIWNISNRKKNINEVQHFVIMANIILKPDPL